MFCAKPTQDDILGAALFEYTTAFINSEHFNAANWPKQFCDFVDEFIEYVSRDRILQVNALIEDELNELNADSFALNEQDHKYLCEIIKYRHIIFSKFDAL